MLRLFREILSCRPGNKACTYEWARAMEVVEVVNRNFNITASAFLVTQEIVPHHPTGRQTKFERSEGRTWNSACASGLAGWGKEKSFM